MTLYLTRLEITYYIQSHDLVYSTPSRRWWECDESKKPLTLFKMTRGGFTCGRLAMIHSSRVRTEFLQDAAAPLGARARPMPSSPPATHIFRPRLRCELANETAHGRTSCRKTCCPCFLKGRGVRSTREGPPFSPSVELGRV